MQTEQSRDQFCKCPDLYDHADFLAAAVNCSRVSPGRLGRMKPADASDGVDYTSHEQAHGDKRIVKVGAQSITTPNQFTVSVKVWNPVFLRASMTLTMKV